MMKLLTDGIDPGWREKARTNIEKHGKQDRATILLCMVEELGELTQAHLQYEGEDGGHFRMFEELSDLSALCYQFQELISIERYKMERFKEET